MGYGRYSTAAHKALVKTRSERPIEAIFTGKHCDPMMDPRGVRCRESRDSEDSPRSVGIVFALDVSSSMGDIPYTLATATMPTFMQCVLAVLDSPQVMFMAVGNAHTDRSPLQVGQFESTASLMDSWLSAIHIESGGGGWGESYELAMYFAARHIELDCLSKRGHKGYLIMTGDEVPFAQVSREHVRARLGAQLDADIGITDMVREVQERFHVFFLIPDAQRAARESCGAIWQALLHERCVVLRDVADTAIVSALLIGIQEGVLADEAALLAQLDRMDEQSDRQRIIETVLPFAQALARGPIGPPWQLGVRHDDPGEGGG